MRQVYQCRQCLNVMDESKVIVLRKSSESGKEMVLFYCSDECVNASAGYNPEEVKKHQEKMRASVGRAV